MQRTAVVMHLLLRCYVFGVMYSIVPVEKNSDPVSTVAVPAKPHHGYSLFIQFKRVSTSASSIVAPKGIESPQTMPR